VGTLAHVLEAQRLSTVMISSVRSQTERLHPPRALHCEFPLGRPLGRPNDLAFQRRVLDAAFDLLRRPEGPVLVDYPEVIEDALAEPLVCPLPPRHDPALPPAVDEAMALRSAYERRRTHTGRTLMGRAISADDVPRAVAAFLRVADGEPWETVWEEAGFASPPPQVQSDVRAYYEESALELTGAIPGAHATESWFYQETETGKVMRRAKKALQAAGYPYWMFFIPQTQMDR
jgi:hypothetical protein